MAYQTLNLVKDQNIKEVTHYNIEYISPEDETQVEYIEFEDDDDEKLYGISHQNAFSIKNDVDKITKDLANDEFYRCSNRDCKKKNILFESSADLEIHNEMHYSQFTNSQCPICNKNLANDAKLVTHLVLRHTPKSFTCDHCGKVFRSKDNLRLHMSHHRKHFYVECRACKRGYKSIQSLRYHLRQHFEHHQCETCGMVFEHKKLLHGHVAAKHNHELQVQCHFCTRLFARSDVRDAHEKEIHKNGKVGSHFKCNECDEAFDLRDELMSHKILNHFSGVIHTCMDCGKNFKKKSLLVLHMHVHRKKSFSCDVCKMFFTFLTGLNKHKKLGRCKGPPNASPKDKLSKEEIALIAKHQLMEITVNPKGKVSKNDNLIEFDEDEFNVKESVEAVIETLPSAKNEESSIKLPVKTQSTAVKKQTIILRNLTSAEIQQQHDPPQTSSSGRVIKKKMPLIVTTSVYRPSGNHKKTNSTNKCDICDETFEQKIQLQIHLNKHSENNQHTCIECYATFDDVISLRRHYTNDHKSQKEKKFECSICYKRYLTNHLLSIHMKSHENLKENKCEICPFKTNSPYDLSNHVKRMHNATRPFECQRCEKKFKRRCDLNNHNESIHSGIKTYVKCPQCDVIVLEKGLHSHILNRHSEKGLARPYVCVLCGKKERYEKNLQRHYDSVHDPKSRGVTYACNKCDAFYYRRRDLTAHSFIHYKGVIHVCKTCGNQYKTKKELTNHEYTHREMEYPCCICDAVFQTKSGRGKHLKKHGIISSDLELVERKREPTEINSIIDIANKEEIENDTVIALIPDDDDDGNSVLYEEYEVLEEVDFLQV